MSDADVVLAMTSRSLRGRPTRPLVIDHVDALSLNMRRRSQGRETAIVRVAAGFEAARFVSWERRCSRWAAAALVTAHEDAAVLPSDPRAEVLPVGIDHVDPAWAASSHRPIDVVFSGNMRYPPNRRAALMLDRQIAPALRRERPDVRVVVVGRSAATLGLRHVEVHSDVPDVLAFLRIAKVAIAPLDGGTGSPYKVLEAAACGAAIVSSSWAAARFGIAARTASDARGYCEAVLELLADPDERAALVAESQPAVQGHRTSVLAARVEELLAHATDAGPRTATRLPRELPDVSGHSMERVQDARGVCIVCGGAMSPSPTPVYRDRLYVTDGRYTISECINCGLGVTSPRLTGPALAESYPDSYPSWQHRQGLLAWYPAAKGLALARLPPFGRARRRAPGRLLDVGLGRGDLAWALARSGWEAHGLDISPAAAASAVARGIDARVGTLDEPPWPRGTFDLVVLSHVLEHLEDPVAALTQVRMLLRPDGIVIVAVPSWDSWHRRIFRERWVHADVPRHLQHFTTASLNHAARAAGFERGRMRRYASMVGLPISIQYAAMGRWPFGARWRTGYLALSLAMYPATWLVGRLVGGDCTYVELQTNRTSA